MSRYPALAFHGGPSGDEDDARVRIDFSVSLNAFGPAPEVVEAIRCAPIDAYPDPTSITTRQSASLHWSCDMQEIVFGAGASELIDAMARAVLSSGDCVVIAEPTYGEYRRVAELAGAHIVAVPWDPETLTIDPVMVAKTIRATTPKMAFICAPNNPTGQLFTRDELACMADTCEQVGGLLVIDQSYDAFSATPLGTPALYGHPAAVHVRSITKEHALAGVRAGFLVAPAGIANAVERVRVPWSASAVAQAAASTALSAMGDAHVIRTIPRLREGRVKLAARFPSQMALASEGTHTVLARVGNATKFQRTLLHTYGIRVRDCTSFGLPEFIRIAARTEEENSVLESALRTMFDESASQAE